METGIATPGGGLTYRPLGCSVRLRVRKYKDVYIKVKATPPAVGAIAMRRHIPTSMQRDGTLYPEVSPQYTKPGSGVCISVTVRALKPCQIGQEQQLIISLYTFTSKTRRGNRQATDAKAKVLQQFFFPPSLRAKPRYEPKSWTSRQVIRA